MKQVPKGRIRGVGSGENGQETNTDYLNEHATEWRPPKGNVHMHLIVRQDTHWRIVDRGSSVCSVPGRCHRVYLSHEVIEE